MFEFVLPYFLLSLFCFEEYISMLLIVFVLSPMMDIFFYVHHSPSRHGMGRILFVPLVYSVIYHSEKTLLSMMAGSVLLVQSRHAIHDIHESLAILASRVFVFLLLLFPNRIADELWWYIGAVSLSFLLDTSLHRHDEWVTYEERGLCEYLLYLPYSSHHESSKRPSSISRPWMMLSP
jgi:hypothetical protein